MVENFIIWKDEERFEVSGERKFITDDFYDKCLVCGVSRLWTTKMTPDGLIEDECIAVIDNR